MFLGESAFAKVEKFQWLLESPGGTWDPLLSGFVVVCFRARHVFAS